MDISFLEEFKQREYYNQCTDFDSLNNLMNSKTIRAYIGFDCTAKSLHVGSLLQIMCLRMLQKYGHRPIVLLGGGTTMIGDPSGKEETRKILSTKEISKNIRNIKKIFDIFLDKKNVKTKPIFVNNFKWLGKLNYIKFLREIGKHFTINKMLSFDSVKLRLEREQSLSYMEFNYMILQAYDFYQLFRNENCILQIGGSDQWGNIVNGVELIRRMTQKESFGLTSPLITLASGAKMGKTEKGAVWLNEELFSPYEYWQFWRNTDDRDVKRFLKFFTKIETSEIEELCKKEKNINNLKIILANEATKILHGETASKKAERTSKDTFGGVGISLNLPEIKIKFEHIKNGINILDLLSNSKIVSSKSEARRVMANKGIKINDVIETNDKKIIKSLDFNEKILKISFGKKKHFIIKII